MFKKIGIITFVITLLFNSFVSVGSATTETPVRTPVPCPPSYVGQSQCFIMENPKKPKVVKEVVPERTIKPTVGTGLPKSPVWYSIILGVTAQAIATTETGQKVVSTTEDAITEFDLALGRGVDKMVEKTFDENWENGYQFWKDNLSARLEMSEGARTDFIKTVEDAYEYLKYQVPADFVSPPNYDSRIDFPPSVIDMRADHNRIASVTQYFGSITGSTSQLYRGQSVHYYWGSIQNMTWKDYKYGGFIIHGTPSQWYVRAGGFTDYQSFRSDWLNASSSVSVKYDNGWDKVVTDDSQLTQTPVGMGTMIMPKFNSIPDNPNLDTVTIPRIIEDDTGQKYWEEQPLLQPDHQLDTGKRYIPFGPTAPTKTDIEEEKIIVTREGKKIYLPDGTTSPSPVTDPITDPNPYPNPNPNPDPNPNPNPNPNPTDDPPPPTQVKEKLEEDSREWGQMITNKFPFSLPWDLYKMLSALMADPVRPELDLDKTYSIASFKVPIKIQHDFAWMDSWVVFFRTFILIGFCIFLIMSTRSLLGGAK